ncbi:MAG: hypothetical protein DRQ47_00675 [Gammaproteobacteria bacterium]|nr:MAG: hypothetical protein DRQ47_00675 [Gammaproteobacteria bacterium]
MTNRYDAVVIGSGFGGSVTANKLANAGVKVAILERGPWRDTIPTRSMGIENTAPFPAGWKAVTNALRSVHFSSFKKTWLTNKKGLFEFYVGGGVSVACSSSVGGGSHVYTALHGRPPDPDYWETISEHTSGDALEPHYKEFLKKMNSRLPRPKDAIPNTITDNYKNDGILGEDKHTNPLTMGLLFPKVPGQPKRVVNKQGVVRFESEYGNDGLLGSFKGSKTTVDIAYLMECLDKGLSIYDLHEAVAVYRIGEDGARSASGARYRVDCIDHKTGKRTFLITDNVFFGAGTFNTLKLLFNSADASKGINPIENLGKGFSGNADSISYWARNDPDKNFMDGTPCHGPLTMKGDPDTPQFISVGLSFVEDLPLPKWMKRRMQRDLFLIGFGADDANGSFYFKDGKLRSAYDKLENPVMSKIEQCFRDVEKYYMKSVYRLPINATVHPLGGARVGDDPAFGVVNGTGEIFGNAGLYVVDAAVFPKSLGVPPSMPIAAWSGHVSETFLKENG